MTFEKPRNEASGLSRHASYVATPTSRLERLFPDVSVEIYAKLDNLQMSGSTKERTANSLLEGALTDGSLQPGGTVVESTSGNLGMALARQCALRDLKFVAVVDERANQAACDVMRAFGAVVDLVPTPPDGNRLRARVERVRELLESLPGSVTTNQYGNPNNPRAHASSTLPEICEALGGEPDRLYVATSTTGTLVGCMNGVRDLGLSTTVVAVDAEGSALYGGNSAERFLPGLGAGFETDLSRTVTPHELARIPEVQMVRGSRLLARREGILAGASTGALVAAMGCDVARRSTSLSAPIERWVFLVHDGGTPYLPTLYNDEWVARTFSYRQDEDESFGDANPFSRDEITVPTAMASYSVSVGAQVS